jgi:hypothetical protein
MACGRSSLAARGISGFPAKGAPDIVDRNQNIVRGNEPCPG